VKHYFEFVKAEAGRVNATMALMTAVAGIANGLAVATAIHTAGRLKPGSLHFREFLLFGSLMTLFWYCKRYSMNESTRLVEEVVRIIRHRILGKLRSTDLLGLEGIDKGIFYSSLAIDANTISASTTLAVNAISSVIMLSFIIIYIGVMSMKALFISVGIVGFMVLLYLRNEKQIATALQRSASYENSFMDNLGGLLNGFKELKMDRRKYHDFTEEEIYKVIDSSTEQRVEAGLKLNVTTLLSQSFLLISIGCILFILPQFDKSEIPIIPKLIAFLIFTAGPISDFAIAIPAISRAEAAINNIRTLESFIDQEQSRNELICDEHEVVELKWNQIVLQDIFFQFPQKENGRPFSIGPMSLEFHKGEITFIVGGNGSGKSTFLKVLSSLYSLNSGHIFLDGTEITPYNKASYRNIFSVIFTDYHLFKRLIGIDTPDPDQIKTLLSQMELLDKTSIENGVITNRDLSTGQKKRLSLIISVLEDKEVIIFDEWAADQDPIFRKYFYDVLLPELKARGKTIIAVTHDDRYFHAADRIYKMEYGGCAPYEFAE
jgi:putative ATP-binding cassette transporter